MIRKIAMPLIGLILLAGCQTMAGLGQDVSTAGDAITDEAVDTRRQM
ncbi:hypothetical protein BH23PSE1_BH23PSE1_15150 [soil metagenome]